MILVAKCVITHGVLRSNYSAHSDFDVYGDRVIAAEQTEN